MLVVVEGGRVWSIGVDVAGHLVHHVELLPGVSAVTWSANRLWMACAFQVWSFMPGPMMATGETMLWPAEGVSTGALDITDLVPGATSPLFAAALLDCVATCDEHLSLRPLWLPPWIEDFQPATRSLLSGIAVSPGRPFVASFAGRTTAPTGWLASLVGGGVLVDAAGDVLVDGLTLPRQPRIVGDSLFVVEAGTGRLLAVADGAATEIAVVYGVPSSLADLDGTSVVVGHGAPDRARVDGLEGGAHPFGAALEDRLTIISTSTGSAVGHLVFEGYQGPITSICAVPGPFRRVVSPGSMMAHQCVVIGEDQLLGKRS
jgi:uncharacterized protein (TIGR03032 family)